MPKSSSPLMISIISTIVCAIVSPIMLVLLGYIFDVPVVKSQINDIRQSQTQSAQQIQQLTKTISRLEGYLNAKLGYNFTALSNLSDKKNISQETFNKAIFVLTNKPAEASSYLSNQMHFNQQEINSVLNKSTTRKDE
jgi:hypothetical protein